MLWEIIFEMLGELFKVTGEILSTFWKVLTSIFGNSKDATPEEKKRKSQLVLIFATLMLCVAVAFMFPQVRKFVFGGGGARMLAAKSGQMFVEKQRNDLPMGVYTSPQLYKKKKAVIVDDDGMKRTIFYYWHAPPVARGQKLPLVVVLHGKDGLDQAAVHLRMGAVQKNFPAFLLIPQSPKGKIWDAPARYEGHEFAKPQPPAPGAENRSLRDAVYLLAKATTEWPVDESRMYIVGCDDGAAGVYGAAVNYTGVFAAGVAVAGKWSFIDRKVLAKTPLLILQGSIDKSTPPEFARNLAQLITAAGGNAAYHEFPGIAHDCDSPNFYSHAVWQWLFAQHRPEPEAIELDPAIEPIPQPATATVAAPATPAPVSTPAR